MMTMIEPTKVPITMSRQGNRLVVIVEGDVSDLAAEKMHVEIGRELKKHNSECSLEFQVGKDIVVNSRFVGVMSNFYRRLKDEPNLLETDRKNLIRVKCPEQGMLRDILGTTNLDRLFNVNPTD